MAARQGGREKLPGYRQGLERGEMHPRLGGLAQARERGRGRTSRSGWPVCTSAPAQRLDVQSSILTLSTSLSSRNWSLAPSLAHSHGAGPGQPWPWPGTEQLAAHQISSRAFSASTGLTPTGPSTDPDAFLACFTAGSTWRSLQGLSPSIGCFLAAAHRAESGGQDPVLQIETLALREVICRAICRNGRPRTAQDCPVHAQGVFFFHGFTGIRSHAFSRGQTHRCPEQGQLYGTCPGMAAAACAHRGDIDSGREEEPVLLLPAGSWHGRF